MDRGLPIIFSDCEYKMFSFLNVLATAFFRGQQQKAKVKRKKEDKKEEDKTALSSFHSNNTVPLLKD